MRDLVFHQTLLPAVERFGDRPCTADDGFMSTYAEHGDRVCRLVDALRTDLGVSAGDRFAVLSLNSHRFLELWHAGLLGGGVVNPLNLRLSIDELCFILEDSGTRVVFTDVAFAPVVAQVRERLPLDHVVLLGPGDVPHDHGYEELLASATPRVPELTDERDPAVLMYTGGTTGLPKGVVLDQRALMLNSYKIAAVNDRYDGLVVLHQAPMFHAATLGGILTLPFVGGLTTFVPAFEPKRVMDALVTHQVQATLMVPTMLQMVMDHPDFTPDVMSSLRRLVYGASPMPPALLDRLLEVAPHLDLYQGYGMTECGGMLTMLFPEDHRRGEPYLHSVGRAAPGTALSIQDASGRVLAVGEVGEVCARAGNFMPGYWNRPEETAAVLSDEWYRTGDMGRLDQEGYLYLVDRVKDMIVTGGENVYSAEVESVLSQHPAVAQVAVIGIPSEEWVEAVHAVVVPQPGAAVTAQDLQDFARERIAGFKVPKSVELREALPMSAAMKVLKRELRAPYWEGRDRKV